MPLALTEGSRAVELLGILLHPVHDRMLAGLIIPAALVNEDLSCWVGHLVLALRVNLLCPPWLQLSMSVEYIVQCMAIVR